MKHRTLGTSRKRVFGGFYRQVCARERKLRGYSRDTLFLILTISTVILSACGLPAQGEDSSNEGATPSPIVIYITATPQPATPSLTFTPTLAVTETPSATPTLEIAGPTVTVNKQAHCRYGPSTAYLHAADLFPGDEGAARYRAMYGNWLYVQFEKLDYSCWVAPSVVDVVGDVSALPKTEPQLLSVGSNRYGPPQNVQAARNDDKVTITWDRVKMTDDDDRGYLIEAFVCQDGAYLWWTDSFADQKETSYTVKDEAGCAAPSWGRIYTVEKHGFSQPAEIPWPPP